MSNQTDTSEDEALQGRIAYDIIEYVDGRQSLAKAVRSIEALFLKREREAQDIREVDRFEVIDETGRAYVKGLIYGTPVSVELSYQDRGRTLKAFITQPPTIKQNKGDTA